MEYGLPFVPTEKGTLAGRWMLEGGSHGLETHLKDKLPDWRDKLPGWLNWSRVENVLLLGVLGFALWRFSPQLAAVAGVGDPMGSAPDVGMTTLGGEALELADLRGQVVLVNFWATWCAPCRLEMPGFEKLYRDKKDEGFVIVGIATDRTGQAGVAEFLRDRDITYPVAMETRELELAFGGISAIPTTFLIDRDGVIRHRTFGYFPPTGVRIAVNRLLSEKQTGDATTRTGANQ